MKKQSTTTQPGLVAGEQDQRFMSSVRSAQLMDEMPHTNWALYLMFSFLAITLIWAAVAKVDVVTKADGRVVPEGREQLIASLEGGILKKLLVEEGEEVTTGQIVAHLDQTRVAALQNEGRSKRTAMLGTLARLQAEVNESNLVFSAEFDQRPDIVRGETETYNARKQALDDALKATDHNLKLLKRELSIAQEMATDGVMSEVEVMRLRRQISDLDQRGQERVNQLRQQASADLVRVQNELAQLDEQMVVRDDIMRRTVLRSPIRGLVKNISVATVGGVVPAGVAIMEIVPLGGRILVEAKIEPGDIGFVREGHEATVRLSAYEYNTYGGLEGIVEYISPDAITDNSFGGESYYRARISADASTLMAKGKPLPVRPGMTGSVEIKTSDRTVLSFLMRPVMRGREAFRE